MNTLDTQIQAAQAVLKWTVDQTSAPYGDDGLMDVYDVAPDMLSFYTSPRVTESDGTYVPPTLNLPEGATAKIFAYHDEDSYAHGRIDEECYSEKDRAALTASDWEYVGVAAVVTLADGTTGESAIWGVERGNYWPGTDESQIWHIVPDTISDALHQAEDAGAYARAREERAAVEFYRRERAFHLAIGAVHRTHADPETLETLQMMLDEMYAAHPERTPTP